MITIVIVLVVGVVLFFLVKSRAVMGANVKLADIPAIFEKLKTTGKDGNFATLGFQAPASALAAKMVNVQFSIEGGQIGFDWVLVCPQNIQDRDKFEQLAARLKHQVVAREGNKVNYLRVVDGDLPSLGAASIREIYALPPEAKLELTPEGFAWP